MHDAYIQYNPSSSIPIAFVQLAVQVNAGSSQTTPPNTELPIVPYRFFSLGDTRPGHTTKSVVGREYSTWKFHQAHRE